MSVIRQAAGGYGKWEEKRKDNFCFFHSFAFFTFDSTLFLIIIIILFFFFLVVVVGILG